jgi:hypothetical protein
MTPSLPTIATYWFDHDRGRLWRVHMIARPDGGEQEITIAYSNGKQMGFELVSPDAWAARVANGRYELVRE